MGRDFSGVNFTNANLTDANFTRAWFSSGTKWPEGFDYLTSGAFGPGVDFRNLNLSVFDANNPNGTELTNANFNGVNLHNKRLRANFNGSSFRNATLSSGDSTGAKFVGADLSGANLVGRKFEGANFTDANLTDANFTRAWFSSGTKWPEGFDYLTSGAFGPGVDFRNLNLSVFDANNPNGTELTNANFNGVNLHNKRLRANFNGSSFRNATLSSGDSTGAKFVGADLSGANLVGRKFEGANFTDANLTDANFTRAWFSSGTKWPEGFDYLTSGAFGPGVDFRNLNLSVFDANNPNGTELTNANFNGVNLHNKRLRANFNGSSFRNATLSSGDSTGAKFVGTDLSGANLVGRKFEGANFTDANLTDANFTRAWFSSGTKWPEGFDYLTSGAFGPGVDFRNLNLSVFDANNPNSVDLKNGNFEGVNLNGKRLRANFEGANFRNATLSGGDSRGAKFIRANLIGANLVGRDLSGAVFTGALYSSDTIWPDGFDVEAAGLVLKRAPVDLNSTAVLAFQENQLVGTLIGEFKATDPDGDAITYHFVNGENNNSFFTLDTNGTLKTATTFDYESNASSYTITVQAKDELNATTEGNFTVTLLNVNEPPVSQNLGNTLYLLENQPVGTVISDLNFSDPEGDSNVSFSLIHPLPSDLNLTLWLDASEPSTISETNGAISRWSDKSGKGNHATQTTILKQPIFDDANQSVIFDGANDHLSVSGFNPSGSISIYAIFSNNREVLPSSGDVVDVLFTVTGGGGPGWSIESYNTWGVRSDRKIYLYRKGESTTWFLNGTQGTNSHTIGLNEYVLLSAILPNASADLGPLRIGTFRDSAFFGKNTFKEIIFCDTAHSEEQRIGVEGYLSHKWGLAEKLPITHPSRIFSIDSNGTLSTNRSFDYETNQSTLTIRISAKDDGGAVTEGNYTVNLLNLNESPHDLNSTAALTITENQPIGTVIGEFNVTDPDGHAITYHFVNGENNNSLFTLDTNGTLKTATTFDYESNASTYTITVQAKDELNATTEGNFTVTLQDVFEDLDGDGTEDHLDNDMDGDGFTNAEETAYGSDPRDENSVADTLPTALTLDNLQILENQPIGSVVGKFTVVDPDPNDMHRVVFNNLNENGSRNHLFTIDTNNTLRTAVLFDFENNSTNMILRVKAKQGKVGVFWQYFTLSLINDPTDDAVPPTDNNQTTPPFNEHNNSSDNNNTQPPFVDHNESWDDNNTQYPSNDANETVADTLPTALTLDNLEILENQPIGTIVGKFTVVDPDPNDMHRVVFNNLNENGSRNHLFTIDCATTPCAPPYSLTLKITVPT